MQGQSFELLLNGVPYFVKAEPFEFNTETRFKVRYNEGDEHIFTWDSSLGRLAAIDDDAGTIPDDLESAIAGRLQAGKY
ncbi:MAG TPA: hypothetical protein VER36_01635 [Flavisolibacter sp.]|nr:hypothetical protein [Flavisolibacter sp.]